LRRSADVGYKRGRVVGYYTKGGLGQPVAKCGCQPMARYGGQTMGEDSNWTMGRDGNWMGITIRATICYYSMYYSSSNNKKTVLKQIK
jgi:hypothetical protein